MRQVEFKNIRNTNLVGDWHGADSDKVIIMCHGFTGDRLEHGRFEEAAKAFNDIGFNVLAFDFSGSGDSDDEPLTVAGWDQDLTAAVEYVQNRGMKHIGIMGHSLGGLIALKHHKDAVSLVIWAPVTNQVTSARDRYPDDLLSELDQEGSITYKVSGKTNRQHVIVPKQMLDDREDVNQALLLKDVDIPVLIVHGDADEAVPIEDSRQAIKLLGSKSKLIEVPDGTHALTPLLDQFVGPSVAWFRENLNG